MQKARSNEKYAGMGTTFVAATVSDHKVTVMNIGDSRLYYGNQGIKTDYGRSFLCRRTDSMLEC